MVRVSKKSVDVGAQRKGFHRLLEREKKRCSDNGRPSHSTAVRSKIIKVYIDEPITRNTRVSESCAERSAEGWEHHSRDSAKETCTDVEAIGKLGEDDIVERMKSVI